MKNKKRQHVLINAIRAPISTSLYHRKRGNIGARERQVEHKGVTNMK